MDEIKLDVQIRQIVGTRSVKAVRNDGYVPAVVYGGGKHGPTTIKVDRRSYEKVKRQHAGQSVVFHLNVLEGEKKLRDYSAIVKEEQSDPLSEELLHIDFKRISLKEEIEVKVPVKLVGEPVGVKQDGGSLDQAIWELDVVCLPTNLPESLEVDVSEVHIGHGVHVKDLALPAGVTTKHDPESMIASVVAPMKDADEEPTAEGDGDAEPEVIGEKEREEKREAKAEAQAEKEAEADSAGAEEKSE